MLFLESVVTCMFLTKQKHVSQNGRNGTVSGEVGKYMAEMRQNVLYDLQDCYMKWH